MITLVYKTRANAVVTYLILAKEKKSENTFVYAQYIHNVNQRLTRVCEYDLPYLLFMLIEQYLTTDSTHV